MTDTGSDKNMNLEYFSLGITFTVASCQEVDSVSPWRVLNRQAEPFP